MNRYDRISAIFWLLFAAAICVESLRMPLGTWRDPGPGFLPLGSGILLGGLSLVCYFQARLRKSDEPEEAWYPRDRGKNLILALAILLAYIISLEVLGFLSGSFLLLLFLFRRIGSQKWMVSIGGSALVSILCYAVFELWLKTQLPKGVLGF